MAAISLRGIGKKYRIYSSRKERLREALSFGRSRHSHDFWALEDINLDVEPGTTLGILGRNGAGKSTLLKIISGVLQPTTGTVEVNGRLVALFGVGSGFNSQFTGRENAMLNGLILGLEHDEMLQRFDEIEAFADIGEFMDQPVKTYSSGMRARLGFAVAINVEPDILILDETLSVGDALFKQMSLQKMQDLRDSGTTILFVSHGMGTIRNFCNEAILLHKGRMLASGGINETLDRYQALLSSIKVRRNVARGSGSDELPDYEAEREEDGSGALDFREDPALANKETLGFRHGTGDARIRNVEVLDELQRPVDKVMSGATITVRVHLQYVEAVKASSVGITLRNKAGIDVFSTSTRPEETLLGDRERGERVVVDFIFEAPLRPDDYSVTATVSYPWDEEAYLDWVDVATAFEMIQPENQAAPQGLVHLPATVKIHGPSRAERDRSA